MSDSIIIIGAGQAGGEIALGLRRGGFSGAISMIGAEDSPPYRRPPLSKAFLSESTTKESLCHISHHQLDEGNVRLITGAEVVDINRQSQVVQLSNGSSLRYDRLALATGGRPRRLGCPGEEFGNIFYLRGVQDAEALRAQLLPGRRLVIVGGGFIGLEVAATARALGVSVTVLEASGRILTRAVGQEVATFLTDLHREAGVDLRVQQQVKGFTSADGRLVNGVECEDGTVVAADAVLVGIGLVPNDELAARAGIEVDNGILTDQFAQTSDQRIVAAGDCTNAFNGFLERRVRLESVQGALDQARAATATLLGKKPALAAVPSFWSEQYDIKIQMLGVAPGGCQVVTRGSMDHRSFSAFYLLHGRIHAAQMFNRSAEIAAARKLITERCQVDLQELENASIPLQELAAVAAV